MRLFNTFVCTILFWTTTVLADPQLAETPDDYYGDNLRVEQNLKDQLHEVLNNRHISRSGKPDQILPQCDSSQSNCYSHNSLSYREARQVMFGHIYLRNTNNHYYLRTAYCQETMSDSQVDIGPMQIPSHTVLNTEHAWPQSLFTSSFSKGMQKTDLHALFPVKMRVNSIRGNRPFGVVTETNSDVCNKAKFGQGDRSSNTVFEPADEVKGDIARALFYFSTRYQTNIDPDQESILRSWHQLDPIDLDELQKHEDVFAVQHTRNPFIDHPEWVDEIENF